MHACSNNYLLGPSRNSNNYGKTVLLNKHETYQPRHRYEEDVADWDGAEVIDSNKIDHWIREASERNTTSR